MFVGSLPKPRHAPFSLVWELGGPYFRYFDRPSSGVVRHKAIFGENFCPFTVFGGKAGFFSLSVVFR